MTMENFVKKFKHTLNNGIIIFMYKKKNGEIRKAIGTTHPSIIPASINNKKYKESFHGKISNLINYYDIEKKGWRSFYLDKLEKTISIVFIKKEGQPSTYHITEEDRRLSEINNEILNIEQKRQFYKNEIKKIKRGTYRNDTMSPEEYRILIDVYRKDASEKMKTLKFERKTILERKNFRIKKEMDLYFLDDEK